jgi:hypothetical protein
MNETQTRWSIKDAAAVKLFFTEKLKTNGPAVANHPKFGAAGGKLCNGPPGRARSPGSFIPDSPFIPDRVSNPVRDRTKTEPTSISLNIRHLPENYYNTEYQLVINKNKIQFITNIKFLKIMKKQILILAFFVLALLAGTLTSFGQLGPATKPITPLSCIATSEPLHPFPGVPYIYKLDGAAGAEDAASYTWWATKDQNFITGAVTIATMANSNFGTRLIANDVLNLSTTYGATTPAATAGSNEVSITWSASVLAGTDYQGLPGPGTPTFVVGYAQGTTCATDNIQVFEINPMPNFTVDIAPIDPIDNTTILPWDDITGNLCVDFVRSAVYNTTTKGLDMDYGTNTFYFEVTAANFVTNWTPHFTIEGGLRVSQTAVLTMYPTLADAKANTNIIGAASPALTSAVGQTWDPTISLTATIPANAATGVSVFVKVLVDNNKEESLTDNLFILAVDGQDNTTLGVASATSIWDMEDADCAALADGKDEIDRGTITVNPRPQLDDITAPETIANPDAPVIKTP